MADDVLGGFLRGFGVDFGRGVGNGGEIFGEIVEKIRGENGVNARGKNGETGDKIAKTSTEIGEIPATPPFACTKCGACCKSIAGIPQLAAFDDGSGVCAHLITAGERAGECAIYSCRPLVCRVREMFAAHFAGRFSWAEFCALNARACNALQVAQGIDESFRVDENFAADFADKRGENGGETDGENHAQNSAPKNCRL